MSYRIVSLGHLLFLYFFIGLWWVNLLLLLLLWFMFFDGDLDALLLVATWFYLFTIYSREHLLFKVFTVIEFFLLLRHVSFVISSIFDDKEDTISRHVIWSSL